MMKKLTPVLVVDAIEPVLPLWDALGFTRTAEVPHGKRLGFVILQKDSVELMYQTFDSVRADEPKVGDQFGRSGLFIEVDFQQAGARDRASTVAVIRPIGGPETAPCVGVA